VTNSKWVNPAVSLFCFAVNVLVACVAGGAREAGSGFVYGWALFWAGWCLHCFFRDLSAAVAPSHLAPRTTTVPNEERG
jgi:hypothetical protein